MPKKETAAPVCQHDTARERCSICQTSLPGSYKAFAGAGDERVEAARPRLLRLAHMSGVGPDEAEDVVQETLLEEWRHLEQLREPERFAAWLAGICRNVCKRHLRARAASVQTSELPASSGEDEDEVFDLPDPLAIDPEEELERQDRQVLLARALGHLSTSARELIELCYLAEVPQREVAQRLDMSLGALELKLHRARRQLRQVLYGKLRDDAQACGLLIDEDEALGWQETRQWCWVCGKQRLRGTFERQPSGIVAFRLRCPDCSPRYGADGVNTGASQLLLPMSDTQRSFRPALKRTLLAGSEFAGTVLSQRRCNICRAPVQIDLIDRNAPGKASGALPPGIYLRVTCPNCEPYTCEFMSVLLMNKDVRAFLLDRPRALYTPTTMDICAGQEAIRSRLLDLTSGERLTIMTRPHTFQVLATFWEKEVQDPQIG